MTVPIENYTIVTIHRSKLLNAPYNPREIDERAKRKLRQGIKKIGLLAPPVWNVRTGHIVGGHRRMEISDALRGTSDYELQVAQVDLDDLREREANLLLNNAEAQGVWDIEKLEAMVAMDGIDLEATGFDVADIYQLFGDAPLGEQQVDELAERLRKAQGWYDDLKSDNKKRSGGPTDFYVVVVFKDPDDRNGFLDSLKLPDNRFQDGRELRRLFELIEPGQVAPPVESSPLEPVDSADVHEMRKGTRRELDKLRELARVMLVGEVCCFCKKELLPTALLLDTPVGERGRPLPEAIDVTVHHLDGDHENNAADNHALCHAFCHKGHHRTIENKTNPPRRKRAAASE